MTIPTFSPWQSGAEKDAEIARLRAELAAAREIIATCEWSAYNGIGPACPECHGSQPGTCAVEYKAMEKHRPGCTLAAWLAEHAA